MMNRSKACALCLRLALVLASLCILPGTRQVGASGEPAATSHGVYLPLLLKARHFLTPAPTVTSTPTPTRRIAISCASSSSSGAQTRARASCRLHATRWICPR